MPNVLLDIRQGGTEDLDVSKIRRAVLPQAAGSIKDVLTGSGEEATDRRSG